MPVNISLDPDIGATRLGDHCAVRKPQRIHREPVNTPLAEYDRRDDQMHTIH
jgi:hypothetical protein